ncbi:MAG: hypothetical protein CM15mP36_06460 [Flavobacteriales bacterium]|nr:MAG: hypothetical protein CM15mP36_06460 [Flavobacteriales bacterium]
MMHIVNIIPEKSNKLLDISLSDKLKPFFRKTRSMREDLVEISNPWILICKIHLDFFSKYKYLSGWANTGT